MSARIDRIKIIEQAERYVKAGKIKEAIIEYERLSGTDPDDVGTLNTIGDLYVQLNQAEKAVRAYLQVAEGYEKRGLFSQALAIHKKVFKLSPDNADSAIKLADLYAQQGFLTDAKNGYLRLADRFIQEKKIQEAIHVYEKITRLDREDLNLKKVLAELYKGQGFLEAALDQLNEIAEARTARGELDAAEDVLKEALTLSPGETKSLVNLVEIYKKKNEGPKAIALIEENLNIHPENLPLLNLLGNFYFEAGDIKKAEEIFTTIIDGHPMNVNARIKLGRIQILKDKLDQAFELFEPLISSLIKKHKDEKAIGLIGLILETQKPHLPALERLASIYRANKEDKKLEVVIRATLDEFRKQGDKEKIMAALTELRQLRPDDADLAHEYRALKQDIGLPAEEAKEERSDLTDKDKDAIHETLDQADLYMQQGLVRNARRILENLRLRYPDDVQIMKKLAVLDEIRTHIDEEDLRKRVEKASALESRIKEKAAEQRTDARRKTLGPFVGDVAEGDKVSTADLFAETDIIPFIAVEGGEFNYYDLRDQIAEELRMLKTIRAQQAQGEMTQDERDLSNIVADFKKDLKTKLGRDSSEIHYQLGIAFMDQGLYQEAIDELAEAAKDKNLSLECFSIISYCHKMKRNFQDAENWLKKALVLAKQGTDQFYALEYDLAELCEQANDRDRALLLFKEILEWNPAYRNASLRFSALEKAANTKPA